MSGAMRKMGVYLGLLEDADGEYAELDNAYDEPTARVPEQAARPVSSISERRRAGRPRDRGGTYRRRRPRLRPALPDHHPAPADLQRGPGHRRELPRRRPGDHEPLGDGRR